MGELTLDPMSFAAITGVACAGEPVPFDRRLVPMTPDRAAYVERLLGVVPTMKATHTMKFDSILSHYSEIGMQTITSPRDVDQVV